MSKLKRCTILFAVLLCVLTGLALSGCQETPASSPMVRELRIAHEADKTEYLAGEYFDDTGLVIDAVYSDGSVKSDVEYKLMTTHALTVNDKYAEVSFGGRSVQQAITVTGQTSSGNEEQYSLAQTPALENSPIAGNTYFFLGSSVTAGQGAKGESMADFLAKRNNCTAIKNAVSGTTLAIKDPDRSDNYVQRLEAYIASPDRAQHLDAFICQLSTNDMYSKDTFGTVTADDVRDKDAFDKTTTFGAIEYIIALARETWDCPIAFYTSNKLIFPSYGELVDGLEIIAQKWDIGIIDLYNDAQFNDITEEEKLLYMADDLHPTRAGYREWWLPKFEEYLYALEEN